MIGGVALLSDPLSLNFDTIFRAYLFLIEMEWLC